MIRSWQVGKFGVGVPAVDGVDSVAPCGLHGQVLR
jgi:hypothetical protein